MIGDMDEINALARSFGISDADSAAKFLNDRRKPAEGFETLVLNWPNARADRKHGVFGSLRR